MDGEKREVPFQPEWLDSTTQADRGWRIYLTNMIQIDKGVDMPSKSEYPFAQMEVKDSFFVPEQTNTRSLSMAITMFNKKTDANKSFEAHVVEGGVRVWRTA